MDSNFRYRGRRPASGRSLRAQRVETDAAKREFGSDSCLFSPPWGGSGGLGGRCPGARGLSEEKKAELREIRDQGLPVRRVPATRRGKMRAEANVRKGSN